MLLDMGVTRPNQSIRDSLVVPKLCAHRTSHLFVHGLNGCRSSLHATIDAIFSSDLRASHDGEEPRSRFYEILGRDTTHRTMRCVNALPPVVQYLLQHMILIIRKIQSLLPLPDALAARAHDSLGGSAAIKLLKNVQEAQIRIV